MANDLNKSFLLGRLTRDPELSTTPNGTSVCKFAIANNRSYTSGGVKKEQVNFFSCVAWSKLGELVAQYCHKGSKVAIEGHLNQRSWEKDGHKHSAIDVVVDEIQFLDAPKKTDGQEYSEGNPFGE